MRLAKPYIKLYYLIGPEDTRYYATLDSDGDSAYWAETLKTGDIAMLRMPQYVRKDVEVIRAAMGYPEEMKTRTETLIIHGDK